MSKPRAALGLLALPFVTLIEFGLALGSLLLAVVFDALPAGLSAIWEEWNR